MAARELFRMTTEEEKVKTPEPNPVEKLINDLVVLRAKRIQHTKTIEQAINVLSTLNIHNTNLFGEEADDAYKTECMIKYKKVLKEK